MAGLFDKQANLYLHGRPTYPSEWYSKLADLSLHRRLAWDVGTGNGQAALGIAEYFERVIATDVSESQLKLAMPHPKVNYHHTPLSMADDELVALLGGENSVDLVTVAQAVHWFDLPTFYALVTRLLRKPGGILAVWTYNDVVVNPEFDAILNRFHATTLPYWRYPNLQYVFDSYKTLPFPFESVGWGTEGAPVELEMPQTVSFGSFMQMLQSWSAVVTAREKGVELLPENLVREFQTAWGGAGLVRSVVYKASMIAGKVRI